MKYPLRLSCHTLSLVTAAFVLSCAKEEEPQAAPTSTEEKFNASENEFLKLWNAGDAEGLSLLFAKDSVRVVSNDGQLPSAGRAAITGSFRTGMEKFKTSPDNVLSSETSDMVELDGGIIMSHGTFTVAGGNGFSGKWASVQRNTDDGMEILMESAHVTESSLAAPVDFSTVERLAIPDTRDYGNAADFEGAVTKLVETYMEGATSGNAALIASTFTPDGIQLVSSQEGPLIGKSEIEKGISAKLSEEDFVPGILSAKTLRMRKVSDSLLLANGTWEVSNENGQFIRFGQWGNIFEIQQDGSVLMKVECAGIFVPAP